MKGNRIEWLDVLRGLAAIGIVLFHFHAFIGMAHTGFAFVAVDVFFALSGVVLALKYTRAIEDGMGLLEFAGVRLRRLYPMVAIAGVFIVALNLAGVPQGTLMPAANTDAWTVFLVAPFPVVSASGAFPPDPPMWSFWAELAVNAVWFFILKAGRRWMLPLGVASMVALVLIVLQMNTLNLGWEIGLTFRLISVVRALAWFSVGYLIAMRNVGLRASAGIFFTSLVAFAAVARVGHGQEGLNELLAATTGVALLNLAYRLPSPGRAVSVAARWLGMLSFPLYMVHAPAGRLLPYFDRMPHWIVLVLVVGGIAAIATVLNEALVRLVARCYRSWKLSLSSGYSEG